MTENEAVNKLKQHFEYLKHAWKPHPDYETMEAIGMAIQALEKQIPKKVVKDGKLSYKCPCCGESAKTETGDSFIDYRLDYCDGCGQKLDWSDEE